ncbi:ABC transporter [Ichthyophthirius multifiliis]|uniref:ABC transporter n=1 Tax=Ichthyophthirius multifiliis TaxID=5932 RepID=G0QIR3_ICHMU|nr:ABC transporter [Ichthyophthirius multifiliis]EGR34817.1 ABC transporter [Ichthyophthirius multifiliis]|eukprot:XP_004040121.1 ABC transporter [Ichthyophthirius multifiliis]
MLIDNTDCVDEKIKNQDTQIQIDLQNQNITKINNDKFRQIEQENIYQQRDLKSQKYIQQYYAIQKPLNIINAIEIKNFQGFWQIDQPPVLKNINIHIQKGYFYGIVGKVGSGKTSFLQLLLEEMPYFKGQIRKKGTVAYVEQEPYIFSGKFIDNVTFGKQFDKQLYDDVINVCQLKNDINQFINKDQTEIGERGVTLSGGQKVRLSLARALYSQSDIYLLDDPLSAVDSKVAKKIYDKCIRQFLKDKTVILATHQIQYTQQCDEIFVFDNGEITNKGNFLELQNVLFKMISKFTFIDNKKYSGSEYTNKKSSIDIKSQSNIKILKKKIGKLFTNELEEKIAVTFQTYKKYLKMVQNIPLIIFTIFLFIISEGLYTSFYYYFGTYSNQDDKDQLFYVSGTILFFFILVSNIKCILIAYCVNLANQNLHRIMVDRIIKAQTQYFDQTPSGRIINKFSTDIGILDSNFSWMLLEILEIILQFFNIFITLAIFNPYILILIPIIIFTFNYMIKFSKPLILASKTLDIINRSPVFTFFSKTIQGIIHIRIYENVKIFLNKMDQLTNNSTRTNTLFWNASRAISFNLQAIFSFIILVGQIINIYTLEKNKDFGQLLIYLSIIVELIIQLSRHAINFDSYMSNLERVLILCNLPHEGELNKEEDNLLYQNVQQKQHKSKIQYWIQKGEIEFQNVFMKYRPELNFVLKGTSFCIKSGQSVGCVGRTGAGKSSLLQALFRMTNIEPQSKILLDGVDIRTIGLNTLRSSISIIPQAPFLFSGNVRKNIDPLNQYQDTEVWEALQLAELKETVSQLKDGLNTDMPNAQSLFSTGQKQLICLARAILKNSKILVLDEATANVDMKTDEIIQNAIKKQFIGCVIFNIAHRINTIADYDKVLVMDQGKVTEFEEPFLLLANSINDDKISKNSIFAQMVKSTGEENSEIIFKIAKKKFISDNTKEYI